MTENPVNGVLDRWWFIVGVLVLAFALRGAASNRSMWYDEACTFWEAAGSKPVVPQRGYSMLDVAMARPLATWCSDLWIIRLPFALAGTASVLFLCLAFREMCGARIAGLSALLLAVSPFHVLYSTELRMYCPALLGAGVCTWFFLRLIRCQSWTNRIGYCIGALIGLYGHAFVSLLIAGQGVFLLFDRQRRRLLPQWIALQGLILAGAIPAIWRGVKLYLLTHEADVSWISREPVTSLLKTFYQFTLGILFSPAAAWIVLTGIAAVVCGYLFVRGLAAPGRSRQLVIACLLVPLAAAIAPSAWIRFYTVRYAAFAQPFLVLALAVGLEQVHRDRLRRPLVALLVAIWAAGLYPLYFQWDELGQGDFREAAGTLRRMVKPEDAIVCRRNAGLPIAFYLRDGPIGQMLILQPRETPPYPIQAERLWLVDTATNPTWARLPLGYHPTIRQVPSPPGYEQISREVIPGRVEIGLSLYQRSQQGTLPVTVSH